MIDTPTAADRRVMPAREGAWAVLVANLVMGLPAYFVAFLFAYGFEAEVTSGNHVAFLVLVAAYAVLAGLLGTLPAWTSRPRPPAGHRAAFGALLSLALNSAVVGAGSIVSATHKDEGSVSAGFSTTTDVIVAGGLFLAAVVLGAAALRLSQRGGAGTTDR